MQSSEAAFSRAKQVIPGGVNSPVRAFGAVGGTPVFFREARGARLVDTDGREYIDLVGSWGPMIVGHAHPLVVEAVGRATQRGTSFGAPTVAEVELAEMIVERVPSVDLVRLVSSGTEAGMSVVRLARGATGRDLVIKFEGCYHGHADSFLIRAGSGALTFGTPSSPGVPSALAALTLLAPFNDAASVSRLLEENPGKVAAVVLEPIAGNMGTVPPEPGFLQDLRELTTRHGALLVFDEVMTGFRVARGGAQELYGVTPDLTAMGKVVGGGLPLGAFGGRREIMEQVAPSGPVYQAGTLSGNPLATAAGIATLELLGASGAYEALESRGARLEEGLRRALADSPVKVTIQRVGSMMTVFFGVGPVRSLDSLENVRTDVYARFFHAMLTRGVYLPPSQYEAFFLSLAHSNDDLDRIADLAREASKELS